MNITRHNYEEFFILYLDNELGSDDRGRVELFVQQNPDLREELKMLQQTRLTVDTSIIYKGKQSLMRSAAGCDISLDNYEEWLLMYVDNELTVEQEIAVENFAIANPAIKTELDILQKTKLQPEENIIYFNKNSLYRKEESTRPVPVIRWWRIAVAAALLFAVSITSFILLTGKPAGDKPTVATTNDQNASANDTVTAPNKNIQPQQTRQPVDNNNTANAKDIKKREASNQTAKNVRLIKQRAVKLQEEIKNNEVAVSENKNKNNLPEPVRNPNIINKPIEGNDIALTDLKGNKPRSSVTNEAPPSFIQTSLQPGNDVAYETETSSAKKTKFRGLLRKITRTIEKATNVKATDDDDRLLVGGLAIRL